MKGLQLFPLLAAGFALSGYGQVVCTLRSETIGLARSNGNAELLGDLVLTCTGGTPTPAGHLVPQINIQVYLNTNATSRLTYTGTPNFTEALLLVDEPNQLISPLIGGTSHPMLNCGQIGAPDNTPSGPGVCSIVSTGNPAQTFDGTKGIFSANGRPNVFQGFYAAGSPNLISFLGVPFDPPGNQTRFLRITNLRADAYGIGGVAGTPLTALVNFAGPTAITFTGGGSSQTFTLGNVEPGITTSVPSSHVVRVTEGFALAWRERNVEFTLKNAAYSAGNYSYVPPDTNYPPQAAQNLPGVNYYTEDGFQWQNNGINAPPSPNPPPGYSFGSAAQTNSPFSSGNYGQVNTGISAAGASDAGTRIAVTFQTSANVTVPGIVYLHPVSSPSTTSGVMVLTATDANGAGQFQPVTTTTIHGGGTAVYEVLYADPWAVEYADIPCSVSSFFVGVTATVNLAPFYSGSATGFAESSPVPRFAQAGQSVTVQSPLIIKL